MDWSEAGTLIRSFLKKYRWAAAVLLAGLLMMAVPEQQEPPAVTETPAQSVQPELQQELEELLSRLEGVGKVRILLTAASGPQTHYQTDEDTQNTADSRDHRVETVVITGADRGETGLVRRVDPPVWLGAVVLCQGADRASVRLAVVEAMTAATGLTSDRISVLKMK